MKIKSIFQMRKRNITSPNVSNEMTCCACKKKFPFNNDGIPSGMKYEVMCPHCKSLIMMRKQ